MKAWIMATLAIVTLGAGTISLHAEGDETTQSDKSERRAKRQEKQQERFEKMSSELGLTEEQQAKMKPILTEMREKAAAIQKDQTLSKEQKREKMKALREQYKPQIDAVLTPEQQAKRQQMIAERKKKMEERREKKAERKAAKDSGSSVQ